MSEVVVEQKIETPPPVVEGEKKEPTQTEKDGARFAAFAKKERDIQRKLAEARALDEKLAARERQIEEKAREVEAFNALKADKRKALKHLGLTKDELEKLMKEEDLVPTQEDIQAMIQRGIKEQELERLKAQEAEAAEAEKAKKEQQEQAVIAYKKNIQTELQRAGEKYEMVNLFGAYEDVYAIIETAWNESGQEISIEDAAKKAEEFIDSLVEKALASKKFSGRAIPPPEQKEAPVNKTFDKAAAVREVQKAFPTSEDRANKEKIEAQKVFDMLDKIPRSKRTLKEQEEYVLAKFTLGLIET